MQKKIMCVLLAAALLFGLCACESAAESAVKAEGTAEKRGGFIENEVDFGSEEISLSLGNMGAISVNSDGTVSCPCQTDTADGAFYSNGVYSLSGIEARMLCDDIEAKFGGLSEVIAIRDGFAYAYTYESKNTPFSAIEKVSIADDGSEPVELPLLDLVPEQVGKRFSAFEVLPQNRYAVIGEITGGSGDDGKLGYRLYIADAENAAFSEILSFGFDEGAPLIRRGVNDENELVIFSRTGGKGTVRFYSLSENKMLDDKETTFSYEGNNCIFAGADEEAVYFIDGGGINRVTRGGTVVERIMDAIRYELNSAQWEPISAVRTKDGSYYVAMFNITSAEAKLLHYSYDPDIVLPAQKEFRIAAMNNTTEMRAAVDIFMREHRDLAVNVIFISDAAYGAFAVNDDFSQLTYEERLSLQAELLSAVTEELAAGNGADLLILGAGQMKKLADAGYLADLSVAVPQGGMPQPIYEAFKNNDGIPAIPIELTVPCIYGMKDNLDGVNTIDDVFAKASELGLYAFQCENTPQAFDYFIYTSYNSLVGMGELNEENFKKFLVYVNELTDKYSFGRYSKEEQENMGLDYLDHPSGLFPSCLTAYRENNPRAAFGMSLDYGVGGLNELFSAYSYEAGRGVYTGAWFKPMPGLDEGAFVPGMCAGINASSENTVLAAEFINLLVSEEVQLFDEKTMMNSGYDIDITVLPPVTQEFADQLVARVWEQYMTEEEKAVRIDFVELTNSLKTPEIIDDETLLILCDATMKYCADEITADEAAAEVKAKLK